MYALREMTVNNKRYEAIFYQNVITDSLAMANEIKEIILQKYSEKELENPTDDVIVRNSKNGFLICNGFDIKETCMVYNF